MTRQIIVVEKLSDWPFQMPACTVVHADDYLAGEQYFKLRNVQVINLCRSYKYLSVGYYCSLLAEARGHRVIPSVRTMTDLSRKSIYSLEAGNLDETIERSLKRRHGERAGAGFELHIHFGRCEDEALSELARHLFETFPCPSLRVRFEHDSRWGIASIRPVSLRKIEDAQRDPFAESLSRFLKKRWRSARSRTVLPYDLAVLHNPDDPLPPSDPRALRRFIKAGRELGVDLELIQRRDYSRLAEYDALFIRDTTQIDHYTYRFAKKAESDGMVVIDDPTSILRCTNKVYLAELLRANRVPTPRTVIAGKADLRAVERALGYPVVLKMPDGSFSRGVTRAADRGELEQVAGRLFRDSELILAQEFMYTEFDWRIGVLDNQPLYACQYFMSKKHWQIVKHGPGGQFTEGAFKTFPVGEAPAEVVSVALNAARLIGDGLYGVDVKQTDQGVYVIEVNDNPNIDAGVEDAHLKGELYRLIIREFIRRLERRRRA
ncbi:MAG TPA: RimK family protein [Gammaproteobacteria bacterium]|nr:RimK family protein [Gammaproteobacteria bacterium]